MSVRCGSHWAKRNSGTELSWYYFIEAGKWYRLRFRFDFAFQRKNLSWWFKCYTWLRFRSKHTSFAFSCSFFNSISSDPYSKIQMFMSELQFSIDFLSRTRLYRNLPFLLQSNRAVKEIEDLHLHVNGNEVSSFPKHSVPILGDLAKYRNRSKVLQWHKMGSSGFLFYFKVAIYTLRCGA